MNDENHEQVTGGGGGGQTQGLSESGAHHHWEDRIKTH